MAPPSASGSGPAIVVILATPATRSGAAELATLSFFWGAVGGVGKGAGCCCAGVVGVVVGGGVCLCVGGCGGGGGVAGTAGSVSDRVRLLLLLPQHLEIGLRHLGRLGQVEPDLEELEAVLRLLLATQHNWR